MTTKELKEWAASLKRCAPEDVVRPIKRQDKTLSRYVAVVCYVLRETEKALQCTCEVLTPMDTESRCFWLPKSVAFFKTDNQTFARGDRLEADIPAWLAVREGLPTMYAPTTDKGKAFNEGLKPKEPKLRVIMSDEDIGPS